MVTVLFWNIDGNTNALQHLACLASSCGIDVFLIAECPKDLSNGLRELNRLDIGMYQESFSGEAKVRALTRLKPDVFRHRFTGIGRDLVVWSLRATNVSKGEILLASVHLSSAVGGFNESDQATLAQEVVYELNQLEDRLGHRNTALVGDFNMNPYHDGMTSATGFHGQMTRQLAGQIDRVYHKRSRRRFYNPMWRLFGDHTDEPPGSYYWDSSAPHNHHWHLLDQLLIRMEIIGQLSGLRILTEDGKHSLIDSSHVPDRKQFSDHLPILFRLDL